MKLICDLHKKIVIISLACSIFIAERRLAGKAAVENLTYNQALDNSVIAHKAEEILFGDQKIKFLGNSFFDIETLQKKLFALYDPGFFEPYLLLNDLENLYKNNGFLGVTISFEEFHQGNDHGILFKIIEGNREKINDILILGKVDPHFVHIMKELFLELKHSDYFDINIFNNILSKTRELFLQYGYWGFELKEYTFQKNNNQSYDLILNIEQGHQTFLKKIIFEDNLGLDVDYQKLNLPDLDHAVPFDQNLIATYKTMLSKIVTAVNPRIVVKHELQLADPNFNTYDLVFKYEKQTVYFGKILIDGCSKTLPQIIMQYLTFKEGDVWNLDKIEQSLKKLKNLKIFKSVSILPQDLSEKNSNKDIVITVVEDSCFEIVTKFGATQASGFSPHSFFGYVPNLTYKFGGSLLWKNVTGISDLFKLDLDYTGTSTNVAASYKKPIISKYLPGIALTTKLFNNQVEQPLPGMIGRSNPKAYLEKHTGLLFDFDYSINKFNVSLSTGLDYINVAALKNNEIFKTLHINSDFFKDRVLYGIIEPTITFNKYDNCAEPTKGYSTTLSAKAMFPFSDLSKSFIKCIFEYSQLMPIALNFSLAIRFKAGYIFNNDMDTILPTERFYLGGLNSVRSYDLNMAPPLASLVKQSASTNIATDSLAKSSEINVPIGAKFMLNLNAEWRCKIYDKLSGVIFHDIGVLNREKLSDLSKENIVGASGFGLRYNTPVGPIRFDIGFKWKRQKEEKPYNWYLTFGQAF